MKKILILCSVLSIAFIYRVGFCTYPEETPKTDSSSGNSLFAKYEDDLLSVDIKDVPLGDVLQKLSDETGILFSFPPPIGEERVMVRFSNFTVPDALNKILSSHDRIFIYEENQPDADESPPSRLKEVRIFTPLPKGTTRGATTEPSTVTSKKSAQATKETAKTNTVRRKTGKRPSGRRGKRQTVASLGDDLKNSDINVRLEAVRRLGSIRNADAIGHLTTALEDKDSQVSDLARDRLQEIQEDSTTDSGSKNENEDNTTEDNEPIDGAPAYGIELMSQDSGNVQLNVNLSDVPESLITAGLWIEYDASQMSIVSADINSGDNAWDEGMSQTVKDPKGPGTYMITAGNLSTVNPDDNSNIDLASIQFQCNSGNCSGQTVTVGPVEDPNFDSVVGTKGGVYDSKMNKQTYTIP